MSIFISLWSKQSASVMSDLQNFIGVFWWESCQFLIFELIVHHIDNQNTNFHHSIFFSSPDACIIVLWNLVSAFENFVNTSELKVPHCWICSRKPLKLFLVYTKKINSCKNCGEANSPLPQSRTATDIYGCLHNWCNYVNFQ